MGEEAWNVDSRGERIMKEEEGNQGKRERTYKVKEESQWKVEMWKGERVEWRKETRNIESGGGKMRGRKC